MKKMLVLLCALFLISGCAQKENEQTLFVQDEDHYALCDMEGDLKTKFIYDDYKAVGTSGYIVQEGKKYSYLSIDGETLIKAQKNVQLEAIDQMIIAKDKDKNYTIYNNEGKQLYKSGKKVKIILSGLPIIYQDKKYTVLDGNGDILETSKNEVLKTSLFETSAISISYEKSTVLYDVTSGEGYTAKLAGEYEIQDYDKDNGFVLYDATHKKVALVSRKGDVKFEKEADLDEVSFKGKSLVAKKEEDTFVLSLDGKVYQKVESYYQDAQNYLVKNPAYIYGPHQFVHDSEIKDLEGVQLNPETTYTSHDIFPVYVKDKGYQYYNFEGKKMIKTTYQSAADFDSNDLAVVSKDDQEFYLIDKKGKKISQKYVEIQHISGQYYAAYETASKYEIIDKDGKKVIDDYFMGNYDIVVYNNDTLGLFNKSGTTYIYNMEDYDVVFSLEGEFSFHEGGYLVKKKNKAYYDMEGNLIYKR